MEYIDMNLSDPYIAAFNLVKETVCEDTGNDWKTYSKNIAENLGNLLYQVANELKNDLYNIDKCVMKFNSLQTRTRVTIPFYGNYENEKSNWDKQQNKLIDSLLPASASDIEEKTNAISCMYRHPEKPIHLLTELMWRFQSENQDDLCLIVNKNSDSPFCNLENNGKFKILSLAEDNNNIAKLNNLKADPPKISIKDYSAEDTRKLLKPVNDFFDKNADSKSIFYVADITEKDYMAGFEFEITLKESKDVDTEKLYQLVQKIRWLLSKYVVELVNTAERIYVTHGRKIYKDNFFHEKDGENAINSIIEVLKTETDIEEFNKILSIIAGHFNVANSEIGQYWAGYRYWSYEVARTVAKIIDELFPIENTKIEDIITQVDIGLEGLNEQLQKNEIPHIFRQLFRGLEREKELFLVSEYRDHFIHSFYVFVMGLIFLKTKSKKILPNDLIITNENAKEILKKWFIVAMCHDIAYILEKGEYILEKYVLNFVAKPKRKKNVLPWVPRLGSLMQIDRLLDNIRGITEENVIELPKEYSEIKASDIIIPIAFQNINHGIWSSLFVYHSFDKDEIKKLGWRQNSQDEKNNEEEEKEVKLTICRAILPHHISEWKVGDFLKDFDMQLEKTDWEEQAKINPQINPFGYLLSLCDTICQAGREAPELSMDSFRPSDLNIKYKEIKIKDNAVHISLHYIFKDEAQYKDKKGKNMEGYFKKPVKYLKLNESISRDKFGLFLEISTNFYHSTDLGKVEVGL
ncbi:MAG: hypothetical protein LBG80_05530 [Bacteroidales bacterium]|jgi:hypothetical protein|nr:hypothetical protein [Bacteroidales bacterium]